MLCYIMLYHVMSFYVLGAPSTCEVHVWHLFDVWAYVVCTSDVLRMSMIPGLYFFTTKAYVQTTYFEQPILIPLILHHMT
jgi:hypothetical protein